MVVETASPEALDAKGYKEAGYAKSIYFQHRNVACNYPMTGSSAQIESVSPSISKQQEHCILR